MTKFWIEDQEYQGQDVIFEVSCFGRRRAMRIVERLSEVERCETQQPEFVEEIQQESGDFDLVTSDDHYIVLVTVPNGAVDLDTVDAEYDRIYEALEGAIR